MIWQPRHKHLCACTWGWKISSTTLLKHSLFGFFLFTESEQLPLNLLEMMSGSSFFQVYSSCLTNLSTPFNTQLINILYTWCLHEWSCSAHKTWKLIISYAKTFKSFSHRWSFVIDATSGSFEPKCDKHDLTETLSLLHKSKQTGRRLVKGLWNGNVHVSSDLLELSNAETEKRNQEYLQLRKEDAHTGLKTAAEDASLTVTLKALLMVVVGFFCVTPTVRLHLFFFVCFPLLLLCPKPAVKISFAELF